MRAFRNVCLILFSITQVGSRTSNGHQDGTIHPNMYPACIRYETALNKLYDCDYFESYWGLSHDDFIKWNPSVKADCSGIKVGHSYCVKVKHDQSVSVSTIATVTPPPSTVQKGLMINHTTITVSAPPSPTFTQAGIVKDCNIYYRAVAGDTCSKIISKYKISDPAQFIEWNPAVGVNCSGLGADYYYCVGIKDTSSTYTRPFITTAIPPNCIRVHPTPTQPGSICKCKSWHQVNSEDTCANIEARYKITAEQFNKWNPLVGPMCKLLWDGYNVCVGV
ncbi:LysM [Daldinia childiae]|uniref:LysM n=1 Tax=Daldinia childiae TaxID=326645 RepID=UPI001446E6EE|nr:LysM [Daldinia childiae]KAF3064419.1 LysM [Daldinia childiae]